MAVFTVRLQLDDDIPEHAIILARVKALKGPALAEFLRLHLYRAIADVEGRLPRARKKLDELQAGIEKRGRRTTQKRAPTRAPSPDPPPQAPAKPPLKPVVLSS